MPARKISTTKVSGPVKASPKTPVPPAVGTSVKAAPVKSAATPKRVASKVARAAVFTPAPQIERKSKPVKVAKPATVGKKTGRITKAVKPVPPVISAPAPVVTTPAVKEVVAKKTAAVQAPVSNGKKSAAPVAPAAPMTKPVFPKVAAAPKSAPARATKKPVAKFTPPVVEAKPKAARPVQKKTAAGKKTAPAPEAEAIEIPPILLEGDTTPPPSMGGTGQRYALGPGAPNETYAIAEDLGELPDSYGTHGLLLTARDPHWLYAHWDLSRKEQFALNRKAVDGHLILRVYVDEIGGHLAAEVHLHPESRHWFVHVGLGGTKFTAELGYRDLDTGWVRVCESEATLTPPETLAEEMGVEFATLPPEIPLPQLVEMVKSLAVENLPLVEAVEQIRRDGHPELPDTGTFVTREWTREQEEALAKIISLDEVRRVWIGSLEITELIRRKAVGELASQAAAQIEKAAGPGSISSPFGGQEQRPKSFWFNINAEVVVYGATEPDASVTIGGRKVALRPDGSFSFRFALPDGQYSLPALAVSADESDSREAALHFSRATDYRGEVGRHPQDPGLKAPKPENL